MVWALCGAQKCKVPRRHGHGNVDSRHVRTRLAAVRRARARLSRREISVVLCNYALPVVLTSPTTTSSPHVMRCGGNFLRFIA